MAAQLFLYGGGWTRETKGAKPWQSTENRWQILLKRSQECPGLVWGMQSDCHSDSFPKCCWRLKPAWKHCPLTWKPCLLKSNVEGWLWLLRDEWRLFAQVQNPSLFQDGFLCPGEMEWRHGNQNNCVLSQNKLSIFICTTGHLPCHGILSLERGMFSLNWFWSQSDKMVICLTPLRMTNINMGSPIWVPYIRWLK